MVVVLAAVRVVVAGAAEAVRAVTAPVSLAVAVVAVAAERRVRLVVAAGVLQRAVSRNVRNVKSLSQCRRLLLAACRFHAVTVARLSYGVARL